jgi:SOS-response transcriptional repressor LexA
MGKSKKPLTMKQRRAFEYIEGYIFERHYAPTLREIAVFIGNKKLSTAQYYVEQLVGKGWLKKFNDIERGLDLI